MSISLNKEEQIALRELKSRLSDRYPTNIVDMRLFGSRARGDTHAESDIDVLIIVKERNAEFDESAIDVVCDILNEYGVYIETVTMTETLFQEAVDKQVPFAINILQDAKSL